MTAAEDLPLPHFCSTEKGRELEEIFRNATRESLREKVGTYVILAAKALVGPSKELTRPPFLAELPCGSVVDVLEVAFLEKENRIRGRIAEPEGWISLKNTETGYRWAERSDDFADFDRRLSDSKEILRQASSQGSGLEAELVDEIKDRFLSDLLYLSSSRRLLKEGLPASPRFEGPPGKTWATSGDGIEEWKQIAGVYTHNVPLVPVVGQLRREMGRVLLQNHSYVAPFLDAYINQATQLSSSDFSAFFEAFEEVKSQVLTDVGGASGLAPRNPDVDTDMEQVAASGPPGGWSPEDFQASMQLFAKVAANTRVGQGDQYFGHTLFGLFLRRLVRRFELDLTLEGSGSKDVSEAVKSEQFRNFVKSIAEPDSQEILRQILDLSATKLSAIRRQVEFVFGQGLPEELAKPVKRATDEIGREGADPKIDPLRKHSAFILEAAERGQLRMLSVGSAAREHILWDAVIFGAFLQDSDDEWTLR
eukprot:TRINITY_DN13911_c0_g1_i3.p1 TRINITY_DN13911_c0_g1~~TRINITY_DN13911_c0_g1_i3.p1  ORF type:complete len:533 (+),score=119.33 TRINITY_DN13911_c0_g1_i3:164-1600(+)